MKTYHKIILYFSLIFFLISLLTNPESSSRKTYDTFLTVDIFCAQSNYQGIQSGWYADILKEQFNMEINIIAPNVSGKGETLYETRLASGNLADIVMINADDGRLENLVEAGSMLDLTPYLEKMPNISQYQDGLRNLQRNINQTQGIYAIPAEMSSSSSTLSSESYAPYFGPYMRWDYYAELNYPEINTLEDLLPILKLVQELHPYTEDGEKTYAFSLFRDWDDNMMMMAKQPACFYGYDEVGFILSKADGSDYQNIMDPNGLYVRNLAFFYEANKLGLIDPESSEQNWNQVWKKYEKGQIFFSPWPWLGQTAYNTNSRVHEGKGFMLVPIKDMQLYSVGINPVGSSYCVGIGSNAKDPERLVDFIDWLYSPEGIMISTSQNGSTTGPEGLTWELLDGEPHLTDFGQVALFGTPIEVPSEWGQGMWSDGVSQLNYKPVLSKDINPNTGYAYDFRLWDSYTLLSNNSLTQSWQSYMGANSVFDFLENTNSILVAPGTPYILPMEPNEIIMIRDKCRQLIVNTSWKMIFADNQTTFDDLFNDLQNQLDQLNYDLVVEYDMNQAIKQGSYRQ